MCGCLWFGEELRKKVFGGGTSQNSFELLIFRHDGSRNRTTEDLPLVFALFIFFAYRRGVLRLSAQRAAVRTSDWLALLIHSESTYAEHEQSSHSQELHKPIYAEHLFFLKCTHSILLLVARIVADSDRDRSQLFLSEKVPNPSDLISLFSLHPFGPAGNRPPNISPIQLLTSISNALLPSLLYRFCHPRHSMEIKGFFNRSPILLRNQNGVPSLSCDLDGFVGLIGFIDQ